MRLTDEQICKAAGYQHIINPWDRRRADAAYAQGQKDKEAELAAQCGPNPCEQGCRYRNEDGDYKCSVNGQDLTLGQYSCPKYNKYLGQQQGIAKGRLLEREKLKKQGTHFTDGTPDKMSFDEFDSMMGQWGNGWLAFISEENKDTM